MSKRELHTSAPRRITRLQGRWLRPTLTPPFLVLVFEFASTCAVHSGARDCMLTMVAFERLCELFDETGERL